MAANAYASPVLSVLSPQHNIVCLGLHLNSLPGAGTSTTAATAGATAWLFFVFSLYKLLAVLLHDGVDLLQVAAVAVEFVGLGSCHDDSLHLPGCGSQPLMLLRDGVQ